MRRRAALFAAVIAALAASSGVALGAGPPASPSASCVATITSLEATQLPLGEVGKQVSGLGTTAPGVVGGIVSDLAKAHSGSVDACLVAEG